jgi:hypothetical protein
MSDELRTRTGVYSRDIVTVQATLARGPLYREDYPALWRTLTAHAGAVADYFTGLGLTVTVADDDGYAYLKQQVVDDEHEAPPRLVRRRALSPGVTLLLVALRRALADFDAHSADPRLVLTREQIIELLEPQMQTRGNEAATTDTIVGHITRVVELGFLRRLDDDAYEVRRIIKDVVTATWLAGYEQRIASGGEDVTGNGDRDGIAEAAGGDGRGEA